MTYSSFFGRYRRGSRGGLLQEAALHAAVRGAARHHDLGCRWTGLAVLALFTVGAGLGILNGRSALRSGLRQVITAAFVAAVTFGVGHLIGSACP